MIAQMWVNLETWNIEHDGNLRTHIELFEELSKYYVEVKEQQIYDINGKEVYKDLHTQQREYKSRNAAMNYVRKLLAK